MLKKHLTPKSTKAYSKTHANANIYQAPPIDTHKQVPEPGWRSQMMRIQKLLIEEIMLREKCDNQLLNMVKHLQQTKKSKLVMKTDMNNISRLFSPHKNNKNLIEDTQSISMCKNLLTTIKSERELQFSSNHHKIGQIQQQIKKINDKLLKFDKIDATLNYLNQQLKCFKVEIIDIQKQTQSQIKQLKQDKLQFNEQIQQIKSQIFNNFEQFKNQQVRLQKYKNQSVKIQQQLNQIITKLQNINLFESKLKDISDYINKIQINVQNGLNQINFKYEKVEIKIKQINDVKQHTKKQTIQYFDGFKKQFKESLQNQSRNTQSIIEQMNKNIDKRLQRITAQAKQQDQLRQRENKQKWIQLQNKQSRNGQQCESKLNKISQTMERLTRQLQTKVDRQQIQFIQYKNEALQSINTHFCNQQDTINKTINELTRKQTIIQQSISKCIQALHSVQQRSSSAFQDLEYQIKMASQSIIETKQSIEQTFYGGDYRSKEKLQSQIQLDCTQQSNQPAKRTTQQAQKIMYIENRIQGLERRMDNLYAEYLGKPVFQK